MSDQEKKETEGTQKTINVQENDFSGNKGNVNIGENITIGDKISNQYRTINQVIRQHPIIGVLFVILFIIGILLGSALGGDSTGNIQANSGVKTQTSSSGKRQPADTETDQSKVKISTKVKALAYYYPPKPKLQGYGGGYYLYVYICGTITNNSEVPIRINAVTLRSENIYGEEADNYTSTSDGIFPLILLPGESAYIARNMQPKYTSTKEKFKKTTLEVDAVPVDPAYAKNHKSLISVLNVKTRFDLIHDKFLELVGFPRDLLDVSWQVKNNATHHIEKIRHAVVLFDKNGDVIGVVPYAGSPFSINAKESEDYSQKIVDNIELADRLIDASFFPPELFKQIDHVKVIAEPPVDESANASSNNGGSDGY